MKVEKSQKSSKGITLIALVITIIVLLILAGVSIATLTGENGILTRANDAKTNTKQAEEDELRKLTQAEAATYLEEHEYADKSGETVTIPAKCAVSLVEGENTLEDGLVIIDLNGNEWVWVEVPKTIYTTATSNTDYTNIEIDMQNYAKGYRINGYEDTWCSEVQHGFTTATDYNNHKNNMLKGVYDNGGFFIARYEVGTLISRSSKDDDLTNPIIKQGAYPYNWITCEQAQMLSNQLSVGGKTSSLMFGIQWDLVLKFIETKGEKTKDELMTDLTSWGNFKNAEFEVNKGSYSIPKEANSWININSKYKKISGQGVLFSTGITDRNSVLNIYDLAGNNWEWTLESNINGVESVVKRGISYISDGNEEGLNYHATNYYTNSNENDGIRPALY